MMESVEERLKRIIECVKCPETGSEHFGEWGILTREQRLSLNNLARDTIDLLDCMDKKIRETQYKIEQGTLIELPCKVGDTVWTINCWHGYGKKELGERYIVTRYELHENVCGRIEIHEENYHQGKVVIIPKEKYMGVTPWVFLTREEAEKRLKELQNG